MNTNNTTKPKFTRIKRVGYVSLFVLITSLFVLLFTYEYKMASDYTTSVYQSKISNLENQILAKNQVLETQKIEKDDKISELNERLKTIKEETQKSTLLDIKGLIDGKLNPQTALLEPKK